jgi:hypothetical protein
MVHPRIDSNQLNTIHFASYEVFVIAWEHFINKCHQLLLGVTYFPFQQLSFICSLLFGYAILDLDHFMLIMAKIAINLSFKKLLGRKGRRILYLMHSILNSSIVFENISSVKTLTPSNLYLFLRLPILVDI